MLSPLVVYILLITLMLLVIQVVDTLDQSIECIILVWRKRIAAATR